MEPGVRKAIVATLDAIVFDVGGTLVEENAPTSDVATLEVRPMENVARDLAELAELVPLGAATNTAMMNESQVREHLARAGLNEFLRVLVTSKDVGAEKPDPRVLDEVRQRLGLREPLRILYVGDRSSDAEAARRAGMSFCYVTSEGVGHAVQAWLRLTGALENY